MLRPRISRLPLTRVAAGGTPSKFLEDSTRNGHRAEDLPERGLPPQRSPFPVLPFRGGYSSAALCSAVTARSQGKATPGHMAHRPLSLVWSLSTVVASSCRRSRSVERSAHPVASATALVVGCGVMAGANSRRYQVGQVNRSSVTLV